MPGSVGVVVEPEHVEIAPGSSATVRVRISNRTGVVDQFVVTLVGADARMTPAPQRIGLFPDQEGTVELVLAVPAERPPLAGRGTVAVRVVSVDDPTVARVEEFALTIGPLPLANLRVEPVRVRGRGSGRFSVMIANVGNVPLRFALRGEDDEAAVGFDFAPPVLDVPPDSVGEARTKVSAPSRWSGPETSRSLTVHADGGPEPLTSRLTFAQRALVPGGLLRGLAVLAVLAALIGGFLLTRQGNEPTTAATAGPIETTSAAPTTSPTASPTRTPTATPGGNGPIPDVAGENAIKATSELASAGFKIEKIVEPNNGVAGGKVIRTDPGPGQPANQDRSVRLVVSSGPTQPAALIDMADKAIWSNGTDTLDFNGLDSDPRGFAAVRENPTLENGATPDRALVTFPQAVPSGFLQGTFRLPAKIIAGDRFTCDVGFLTGAGLGEVDFTVFVLDEQGIPRQAGTVHHVGTGGTLQKLDVDLSQFAGRDRIRLRVDAGTSASQDLAVWVNPVVQGAAAS
ncbi:MAG TPA: PASTA domain-containing protein [Mycobacteriales bacterium]|nr:PASTA domain-containing protein [Mycobacteriales bacterium]